MHEVKSINFESGLLQPILKQKGEECVRWQKWASEGWGGGGVDRIVINSNFLREVANKCI